MTVIQTFYFSSNKRNICGINLPQKILRWISRFHNTPESHISSTLREIGENIINTKKKKKPTWTRKGLKIALNLKSRKFQYPSTFFPLTLCNCGILD